MTAEELPLARLVREEIDRIVDLIDRVEVFGDDRPIEREPINIHVVLDRVKLLAKTASRAASPSPRNTTRRCRRSSATATS